jgi:hypothetical protein
MPTTTTNYALNLPTVGSDDDQWGSYLNTNFTKIDTQLKTLNDAIADQDLEELGNVVNTTPAEDQVLQFNGQNWSASTLTISDISGLQTALDDKADDSDLTGITTNPADGSISYAKLNTALQVQVDRILLTDDDATPADNQILKYSTTDSEWKYADLPGSTVQTLSDVNTAALADDAVLVYNSTAGEFQFESGATLRTTLGVDISGTDNSTPVTLSGSLDYLTLSGQAITLQQINLTTDVTDTLPVASGGTGSATASDARTALGLQIGVNTQAFDAGLQSISGLTTAADKMLYTTASDTYAVADLTAAGRAILDDADSTAQRTTLGLGALATQDTITESQISDLGSYITASSTDTLTNKSGNISQWANDAGYLTAETNDLTNVSGTLGTGNGGTGLSAIGTANQVLAVNTGATALEFQTISITESQISDLQSYLTAETNDLSAAVTWANVPDGNITESSVTQHQAALSITESQISDLQSYLTAEANDLSSSVTWANVPDGNITESSVTQHQAALSITESQISDLQSYLTAEANDLSSSVTWANVPDGNITESSVTQHQAALSITESQISDLQSYLTAEVNDLGAAVTGTLGIGNGGTGLTALGSAGQVLTVNTAGTALEYQTPSGGGGGITEAQAISYAIALG